MRRLPVLGVLALGLLAAGLPIPAAAQSLNPYPNATNLPDLTASLTVSSAIVGGGDQVTYTLTIQNVGLPAFNDRLTGQTIYWNAPASGVSVLQTLPPSATFRSVSATAGLTCAYVAPVVTCTGGSLLTNASGTISVTALAPKTAGTYASTVSVDPTNAIAERSETNNTASVSVVVPQPDLTASISQQQSSVDDGGLASFIVRVSNPAPAAEAVGVTVRYTMPTGASLWIARDGEPGWSSSINQAGFSCSAAGTVVTCAGGDIPSGGTGAISLSWFAPRTNGTVSSTVVVDPNNTIAERDESNNSASINTTVIGRPDLTIDATHTILGPFQRTVSVHNIGVGNATGVRVDIVAQKWEYFDDGPPDLLLGVYPDSGFTCSVSPMPVDTYINYNSGDIITCTGGSIPAGGTATIRIMHWLMSVDDSRYTDATVDPLNTIREANESNNHVRAHTRI